MEIHPKVIAIQITGFIGIWVYLLRGKKNAIFDTGPKFPLREPPEKLNKPTPSVDLTAGEEGVSELSDEQIPPVIPSAVSELAKVGMGLSDIDYILNSHIHFDHTAGNAAVKEISGAEILIHADDAIYFKEPKRLFERELAGIVEEVLGKEHVEAEFRRYMEEETGPGPYIPVDTTLSDGDVIELGEDSDLEVIHLPGHTPGSVGFYWRKEGILFAGDSLEGVCGFGGGLPIMDDLEAYERSIERVLQLPLKKVLHAHPFSSFTVLNKTVMEGEEIGRYLNECRDFSRSLREAAGKVVADYRKRPFLELYDSVVEVLPEAAGLKKSSEMPKQYFSAGTLLKYMQRLV